MKTVNVKKMSAGSIFKLVATGLTMGFITIFILFGIMGAFGLGTFTWNGQPVTGIKALFISPLMGIFMSILFTLIFGSITVFGLWVFSLFKPINIKFVVSEK